MNTDSQDKRGSMLGLRAYLLIVVACSAPLAWFLWVQSLFLSVDSWPNGRDGRADSGVRVLTVWDGVTVLLEADSVSAEIQFLQQSKTPRSVTYTATGVVHGKPFRVHSTESDEVHFAGIRFVWRPVREGKGTIYPDRDRIPDGALFDRKRWAVFPSEFKNDPGIRLVRLPQGDTSIGSRLSPEELRERFEGANFESLFLSEGPVHPVSIAKHLYLSEHEVTVGQFRRFVQETSYRTDAEQGDGAVVAVLDQTGNVGWERQPDADWHNPYFKQTDNHPVTCVSWNDAQAFVDWLNRTDKAKPVFGTYRLPTEAEWEYACRAGSDTVFPWGDRPADGLGWANVADAGASQKAAIRWTSPFPWDDGYVYTAPVGSYRRNAFGLYDMTGNVLEWCEDSGHSGYQQAEQSGGPPVADGQTYRILRGGAWFFPPLTCRSAYRLSLQSDMAYSFMGFRICLEVDSE